MTTHSLPKCHICKEKVYNVTEYPHDKFQIVFCRTCGTPAGAIGGKKGEPFGSFDKLVIDLKKRMLELGKDVVEFTEAIRSASSRL